MVHRSTVRRTALAVIALLATGCGGDEAPSDDGAAGVAGFSLVGGSGGAPATGGSANATGGSTTAGANGGALSSGGSAPTGGGSGQPVGSLCVNDANCDQSGGVAVCCTLPGCDVPCECRLDTECAEGGLFLECNGAADCERFGGGKVCCDAGSMRFCSKPSACPGATLP